MMLNIWILISLHRYILSKSSTALSNSKLHLGVQLPGVVMTHSVNSISIIHSLISRIIQEVLIVQAIFVKQSCNVSWLHRLLLRH